MIKTDFFSFLRYNKFTFGEQTVSQFVVFECKYWFSIIFFYFHKSASKQDRFHTHAFNAISIRLFGDYIEEFLTDESTDAYTTGKRSRSRFLYIPRNSYHRITKSDGCLTLLLSGPWKNKWKEYIDGEVVSYSWGRKK
jgi:hypothetical protein